MFYVHTLAKISAFWRQNRLLRQTARCFFTPLPNRFRKTGGSDRNATTLSTLERAVAQVEPTKELLAGLDRLHPDVLVQHDIVPEDYLP